MALNFREKQLSNFPYLDPEEPDFDPGKFVIFVLRLACELNKLVQRTQKKRLAMLKIV